jgi:hypothetical protein
MNQFTYSFLHARWTEGSGQWAEGSQLEYNKSRKITREREREREIERLIVTL